MNGNLNDMRGDASRPASTLNVLSGIWLIISPWVLGFYMFATSTWDMVACGIAVLVLAAVRLGTVGSVGVSWVNFLVGIWLIISPFILAFDPSSGAYGDSIVMGILVAVFSLWAALAPTRVTPPQP